MPSSSTAVDETRTSGDLFGANPSLNRHHFMCSPAGNSPGTQIGVDPLPDGAAAPESMSGLVLDTAVVLSLLGAMTIGSSVTTGAAPSTPHPSLSPQTDPGAGGMIRWSPVPLLLCRCRDPLRLRRLLLLLWHLQHLNALPLDSNMVSTNQKFILMEQCNGACLQLLL
jgi:hypothetical protein